MECLAEQKKQTVLTVYIQPRASRNRVVGLHGGALKLAITAPPVEGKANQAVVSQVAQLFGLPKSRVLIVSGQQGRTKQLALGDLSLEAAHRKLTEILTG